MGTRSLLAYESKPGKYYVQYMQFDGIPEVKGKEYYEGITRGLAQEHHYFIDKEGNPNKHFRERIKHFLNNYQYASGHSIGNHYTIDSKEWTTISSGQEWQYLWSYNGDFSFFHYREKRVITIPWDITRTIFKAFYSYGELEPVYNYFNETALNDPDSKDIPILKVISGEKMSFPEQGAGGYRTWSEVLKIDSNGVRVLAESHFVPKNGEEVRNQTEYKMVVKSS
jgi:hypothetical protein